MKKIVLILTLIISVFVISRCGMDPQKQVQSVETTTQKGTQENNETQNNDAKNTVNEKIVVYVSGPEEMLNKIEQEFEAEHGDVVDMIIMSCGQVRSKAWSEQEAGKIQADILFGSDPLIYNKLEEKGLIQKVDIKDIQNIKEEYVLKDKNYILVNERYITLMYNKDGLKEGKLPESYDDLVKDNYKDLLVMADASQSSTALGITSALSQIKGTEYLENLKKNGVFLSKSNGEVPSKIMEGQFDLGIAPHDSLVRLKNKAKKEGYEIKLELIWPKEGAIAIQRPLALVKDDTRSKEKTKVANDFMNYMVSKKAQMITEKFGFVSVRKDIENKHIPQNVKIIKVDWDMASKEEDNLLSKYKEIYER